MGGVLIVMANITGKIPEVNVIIVNGWKKFINNHLQEE